MKIINRSAKSFFLLFEIGYIALLFNFLLDFSVSVFGLASQVTQAILNYLASKPVLVSLYHTIGPQLIASILRLDPYLLFAALYLTYYCSQRLARHNPTMDITRASRRTPIAVAVVLAILFLAIALCLDLMKPWLMIALHHPVHTLFAGLSLWCLKHGIQLMMKVHNRIEMAWIKMYDRPLAILSDFKSKMNLISAAKWVFNTALLSKLLFFIITSSGLSGLYQAAWIGLNVMASVSWLLDDTLLMLEHYTKEAGLFYEDFFMKLCIFSSALSVTSYGVVPAFAFMQCLYVMPQLKQDYFDSEITASLDPIKPK